MTDSEEWEEAEEKPKKKKRRIKGPYRKAWLGGKRIKYS